MLRLAVAVSGGADSMCLAWLTRQAATPIALIVDHGLRPDSAAEAAETAARLAAFDVESHVLRLFGLSPGPGLAARARTARYAALAQAAARLGLTDILLGHHARDQAETVLMRRDAGSGPAGLAAMPYAAFRAEARLVRPLLHLPPGQLRATLRAAGIGWIEDPSNRNPAALRTRLRARLADEAGDGRQVAGLVAEARRAGAARRARDHKVAGVLAERVSFFPQGHAVLTPGPIDADALASVIRMLGGRIYAPSMQAVSRLAAAALPLGTLGGVRLLPAGRLGPGTLLVREASSLAPSVPAIDGAMWDGRFRLAGHPPHGASLGALGAAAGSLRHLSAWPSALLETLPVIRLDGMLRAVPHLANFPGWTNLGVRVTLVPTEPAAGAAWAGDAQEARCHHVRC